MMVLRYADAVASAAAAIDDAACYRWHFGVAATKENYCSLYDMYSFVWGIFELQYE